VPHGLPDPISGSRQHFEDDVVLDAGLTLVVDAVGERKRVLDLGCGSGRLARALALRECDVVGFDSNPVAVEEARKYCTHAGVADLDAVPLDELLGEDRFDVIVSICARRSACSIARARCSSRAAIWSRSSRTRPTVRTG